MQIGTAAWRTLMNATFAPVIKITITARGAAFLIVALTLLLGAL